MRNRRTFLKLIVIALVMAIFSYLNLSLFTDGVGESSIIYDNNDDDDDTDSNSRQLLNASSRSTGRPQAMVDTDANDYGELVIPEWLTTALNTNHKNNKARLKVAMDKAASNFYSHHRGGNNNNNNNALPKHTLADISTISQIYSQDFGIVMYNPPDNNFILLYNGEQTWVGGIVKLVQCYQALVYMLRQNFPNRFNGVESDELAIAIGSGDYPHIRQACLNNFPHAVDYRAPCNTDAKERTPVLQFASVFRHNEILPYMMPMPMPSLHLPCFLEWTTPSSNNDNNNKKEKRTVCSKLSTDLDFGKDNSDSSIMSFEDLIPQVVWRGTNFAYLNLIHQNALIKVFPNVINSTITPEMNKKEVKTEVVNALRSLIDANVLLPRWMGVALTIVAEHELLSVTQKDTPTTEKRKTSSLLPWINIKFVSKTDQDLLAKYGVQSFSESMSLETLAGYKYHIDLGGGGGTTWTGTIQKAAMPGLLFHHVTPTKDYIHDYLIPWVHYIPVAGDLRDLKEKYDWAEEHPQVAQLIAQQGMDFVRHLATPEGFDELYHSAFIEPVRRVIEAYVPVSTSSSSLSWREVLRGVQGNGWKQVMECTGNAPLQCDDESMHALYSRHRISKGEEELTVSFRDI